MLQSLTLAILCGGPSAERGISLNSARSVCDHLEGEGIDLVPIYFDASRRAYELSRGQLYSNTPSDFDFKLSSLTKPLSWKTLQARLQSCDLVFPVIHGAFGEDGELLRALESWGVPYVGSSAASCELMFDKFVARTIMDPHGFETLPALLAEPGAIPSISAITSFLKAARAREVVVKPAQGGSSLGVTRCRGASESRRAIAELLSEQQYGRVIVEPLCQGTEFTVVVLESQYGLPVALPPLEVETNYAAGEIFDFRKKYLPHHGTRYHCPARFTNEQVRKIRLGAEQLFGLFGMHDFVRIDGWLLDDGRILFTDINPMSGLEQNSFIFIQSSRVGFSHRDVLMHIINQACRRFGIPWHGVSVKRQRGRRIPVPVLFGGSSAERQVSVMSGTNAWLKLSRSATYDPRPVFLDRRNRIWEIPYTFALNHTVEEIEDLCRSARRVERRLTPLASDVHERLGVDPAQLSAPWFLPRGTSLRGFLRGQRLVLLGLHGGIGENGTIQRLCDSLGVKYNGPGAEASRLCMDKFRTGEVLARYNRPAIRVSPKVLLPREIYTTLRGSKLREFWRGVELQLGPGPYILKPNADGCSAGVVTIEQATDIERYVDCLRRRLSEIPPGTFQAQGQPVELPMAPPPSLIIEALVSTDKVSVEQGRLHWRKRSGLIEITVGVLGKRGAMKALPPSVTVAREGVLTVEEKFQGGTGVNITPPPSPWVKVEAVQRAMRNAEIVARELGLSGYSRIDAFMDCGTGDLIVLEANTLPALTPSTVLFQQAYAAVPSRTPQELLEEILGYAR